MKKYSKVEVNKNKATYSLMKLSKNARIVLFVIILTFSLLRFVNLDADRPIHLYAQVNDEYYKNSAVINKVNFGSWVSADENTGLLYTTAYNVLQYPIIKNLGVSFYSLRLLSVIGGLLSILFLYLILRKDNKDVALFAAALLSTHHLFFVLNRVALPESLQIATMLFSFYLISRDESSGLNYFLAGLIMGLAFLLKIAIIYASPALLVFLLIQYISKKIRLKQALYYCFGYGIILIIFYSYVQLMGHILNPLLEFTNNAMIFYLAPARLFIILFDSFLNFPSMFILLLLTILYFIKYPLTPSNFIKNVKGYDFTEKLALSALFIAPGVIFAALLLRYWSFIFIPLVIFPSLLLFKEKKNKSPSRTKHSIFVLFFLWFTFCISYFGMARKVVIHSLQNLVRSNLGQPLPHLSKALFSNPYLIQLITTVILSIIIFIIIIKNKKLQNTLQKYNITFFLLLSTLTYGLVRLLYYNLLEPFVQVSFVYISTIAILLSLILFHHIQKSGFEKKLVATFFIYCITLIILFTLIIPTFTVKQASLRVGELTNKGDTIIGLFSHGMSIESKTIPIRYKFYSPFKETLNSSIYDIYRPKLYLKPISNAGTPSKKDVPYHLKYIESYEVEKVARYGRPRAVIQVYEIDYSQKRKNHLTSYQVGLCTNLLCASNYVSLTN